MSEMVIMPKADWQAALEATRAKTGKGELIKSGELAAEIKGITGGGGKPFDCRSVTFMHAGEVQYVRSVGDGDTCADPVARGLVDAPTKESTAQYTYPHAGWSLTDGGSASSSALANVTEDRTVYAAFSQATRYYTITYYDADGVTVLRTEQLPYGTAASSYIPTAPEGYAFGGWNPAFSTVVADASYTVVWSSTVSFANSSWADIAEVCESGQAANVFSVGMRRSEIINGTTYTLEIIGLNHDDKSDGSGKAGITVWMRDYNVTATKNAAGSYPWIKNGMHTGIEEPIYDLFSSELQAVVKTVKKAYRSTYSNSSVTQTGDAKIFSLSLREIGANAQYPEGNVYEKFQDNTSKTMNSSTATYASINTGAGYWLRSPFNTVNYPSYVSASGSIHYSSSASASWCVRPCFCI